MALIVFLGLPYCAATGGHVAVDVLGPVLDRPAFRWLNVALPLAGAALTAVMAWQSVLYALASRSRGEATNMLNIDLFPFQLLTAASMALFCAVLLIQAWKALRR
jgi:TRAP-type C4-dicarboxylate transport system permease small subunit